MSVRMHCCVAVSREASSRTMTCFFGERDGFALINGPANTAE
jgi:hypothetical protein